MPILVLSSGFRPVIRSATPYSLLGKAVIQHLSRHLQYGKHQKKLLASSLASRRIFVSQNVERRENNCCMRQFHL